MDLDKLKFWKKKDEFADLDKELGTLDKTHPTPKDDLGLPVHDDQRYDPLYGSETGLSMEHKDTDMSFGMTPPQTDDPFSRSQAPVQTPQQPRQTQQVQPLQQGLQMNQTQLDLIAAKLETIKVSIESMNHRMVALEHTLHVKDYQDVQQQRRRRGVW